MAEDKKSFILYADLLNVIEKLILKDRENKTNHSGELFYHILQYVNDKEPIPVDFIIEMAFEPIKLQLKRDLKKYEIIREKRSKAGKKSAEQRAAQAQQNPSNSTCVDFDEQCSTNPTVTVNDTVNVNVNDNVTDTDISINSVSAENEFSSTQTKKNIEDRLEKFRLQIEPFREKYSSETLNDFWRYWTEKNENGKKMRFEMQKVFDVGRRLITWSKNENKNFNGKAKSIGTAQSRQERVDEVRGLRISNQQALAAELQKYITGDTK